MYLIDFLDGGLLNLSWWQVIVATLLLTHVTIAAVTIFLHRSQAHRALDLHPAVALFFRTWLWLTTGMQTKEWVAIHRKHHAKCETPEDPHSPQTRGLKTVLWSGAELYMAEAQNAETLARYGHGTPNDWFERNVFSRFAWQGCGVMLVADVVLFGAAGLAVWAIQMIWIPFHAAGIINGIGHFWGYRNFDAPDASTNISPWGIWIGGEELHNNHHTYPTSAKLSNKWYEFDIGWLYIRILSVFGLAHVKKVAPRVKMGAARSQCDAELLQAVITHRYEVLARYASALKDTWLTELHALKNVAVERAEEWVKLKTWLNLDAAGLPEPERARLSEAVKSSRVLSTVHSMREELTQLWARSSASREQLVRQLDDWCERAEASGIVALEQFSRRLRCYA